MEGRDKRVRNKLRVNGRRRLIPWATRIRLLHVREHPFSFLILIRKKKKQKINI